MKSLRKVDIFSFLRKTAAKDMWLDTMIRGLDQMFDTVEQYLKDFKDHGEGYGIPYDPYYKIINGYYNRAYENLEKARDAARKNEEQQVMFYYGLAKTDIQNALSKLYRNVDVEAVSNKINNDYEKSVVSEGKKNSNRNPKNIEEQKFKDMSSLGVEPIIINNSMPIFEIEGQQYTMSRKGGKYFNITKMRFVTEEEMNSQTKIKDLGSEFSVPFFWAASALYDKAVNSLGGKNMVKKDPNSGILNILEVEKYYVNSKYKPEESEVRKAGLFLINIESSAVGSGGSFEMKTPLNIFKHIYSDGYQKTTTKDVLFVEYIYSPSGTVNVNKDGTVSGLNLKSVNIVDGEIGYNIQLKNVDDISKLISTIDNRIASLKKVNSMKVDMSNAR